MIEKKKPVKKAVKKSEKKPVEQILDNGLTAKEFMFCNRYLYDPKARFNGTESARTVYDAEKDNTLSAIAYENLRKPHIKKFIEDGLAEMSMSANEVIARLNDIARGKITDVLDDAGNFDIDLAKSRGKDSLIKKLKRKRTIKQTKTEVRDDMRSYLAEDEVDDISSEVEIIFEEVEFELYSAHEALRDLGKHHKLFTDKFEGDLNLTQTEVIKPKLDDDSDG